MSETSNGLVLGEDSEEIPYMSSAARFKQLESWKEMVQKLFGN